MIATIDIKCTAAHPEFPLQKITAFKDGNISLRIIDIPKKIGDWQINEVYVQIEQPDNTNKQHTATLTKGVWVVTFPVCDTIGKVEKGYSLRANGINEKGEEVTNYILGVGDVVILPVDSTIIPDEEKYTVHLTNYTENHNIGDMWYDEEDNLNIKTQYGIKCYLTKQYIEEVLNILKEDIITDCDNTYLKKTQTQAETVKTNNRLTFTDRANKNTMVWDGRGEGFLEFHGATNGIEFMDNAYNEFHSGGIGVTDLSKYKVYSWDNGEGLNKVLGNIVVGGEEDLYKNDSGENKAAIRAFKDEDVSRNPHRLIKSIIVTTSPDATSATQVNTTPKFLKLKIKNQTFKSQNSLNFKVNSTQLKFIFDNIYCPSNEYIEYSFVTAEDVEENVKLRVDAFSGGNYYVKNAQGNWTGFAYAVPLHIEYAGVEVSGGEQSDLHFFVGGYEVTSGCIMVPQLASYSNDSSVISEDYSSGFYAIYGPTGIAIGCGSGCIGNLEYPTNLNDASQSNIIELKPYGISSATNKHNRINCFTIGSFPPSLSLPTPGQNEVIDFEIWVDGRGYIGVEDIPLENISSIALPEGQEIKAKNGYLTIVHITATHQSTYHNPVYVGSVGYYK